MIEKSESEYSEFSEAAGVKVRNHKRKRDQLEACPAELALSLVATKWTARILYILRHRPMNFAGFLKILPEISEEVLATRIANLSSAGLIEKKEDWFLTAKGRSLVTALDALAQWGIEEFANQGFVWKPPVIDQSA